MNEVVFNHPASCEMYGQNGNGNGQVVLRDPLARLQALIDASAADREAINTAHTDMLRVQEEAKEHFNSLAAHYNERLASRSQEIVSLRHEIFRLEQARMAKIGIAIKPASAIEFNDEFADAELPAAPTTIERPDIVRRSRRGPIGATGTKVHQMLEFMRGKGPLYAYQISEALKLPDSGHIAATLAVPIKKGYVIKRPATMRSANNTPMNTYEFKG